MINENIRINNFPICVSIVFLSFFSLNSLGVNPAYFLMLLCVFVTLLLIISEKSVSKFSLNVIFFSLSIATSQLIGFYCTYSPLKISQETNGLSWFIFVFSSIYAISYYEFFKLVNREQRFFIYKNCAYLLLIFLLIELVVRIVVGNSSLGVLYGFKKSLMYFDSNFTGLVIMSFLMFFIYLNNTGMTGLKIIITLLILFLLLTMSRAAMLASLIGLIIFYSHSGFRWKSLLALAIYLAVFTGMCILYLIDGISFVDIDGSFNSKFYIASKALELYQSLPLNSILFGVGLGNFDKYTEIFAHSIFVTMFIEMGLIGTVIFIVFIIYSSFCSKGSSLYIWLPTFICGISLFGVYSPFLFVINAALVLEEKSRIYGDENISNSTCL